MEKSAAAGASGPDFHGESPAIFSGGFAGMVMTKESAKRRVAFHLVRHHGVFVPSTVVAFVVAL